MPRCPQGVNIGVARKKGKIVFPLLGPFSLINQYAEWEMWITFFPLFACSRLNSLCESLRHIVIDAASRQQRQGNMEKLLLRRDLKAAGYIPSDATHYRQIAAGEFPQGRLIAPNTRAWTESEIEGWLASRPTAMREIPANQKPEALEQDTAPERKPRARGARRWRLAPARRRCPSAT
jgi:predicted DNA-binding transcriptional regulator AlpA